MGIHSIGYLFREGVKGLWKNRTMSIASVCVLISCLLMTGLAGLISINLSATMRSIEANNTITVFLSEDLPPLTAVKVGEEIRAIPNISECTFVPKEDGLKGIIQDLGGEGELFNVFQGKDNPLPDAYTISMADLSLYDQTEEALLALEGVDQVANFRAVANMLSNLDRLVRYVSLGILIVLGLVALFIISNTLKVTIFSRRMEIIIMKSVGATNGFVRVPFIVEGILIGVLSGAISATALYLGYDKAVEVVYSITTILTVIDIEPYIWWLYGGYLLVGAVFGIMGGVISIGKYLKKEGENAII
ncbi:permease-like cell division protein FtsX [Acutalibacter caecimuris]|uniref:permease-like cell division protein FtsX n=1 Tax=Acutalibacter caecimuris TaxID=3093657 RepID=UPI002AC9A2F6|nr:permease-like cell division protein FtsX [Acutalibacter sp. M00118]